MTDVRRLPSATTDHWDWQSEAACRGTDTEKFFHPENERGPRRAARENAAKAICHTCPVMAHCAAYALRHREPYGIWGGLSETERDEILAAQRREAS